MVALTLAQTSSIPDVLLAFRYNLLMTPPNTIQTNGQQITLRCQSVMFPGSEIDAIPVALNGFNYYFRGMKRFSGVMSCTFAETSDCIIWSTLKGWQEYIVGTASGNGAPKAQYAISADLEVYDEQGQTPAMVAYIYNLWPSQVPDVTLESQNSANFLVQASFQYDYVEYSNVAPI